MQRLVQIKTPELFAIRNSNPRCTRVFQCCCCRVGSTLSFWQHFRPRYWLCKLCPPYYSAVDVTWSESLFKNQRLFCSILQTIAPSKNLLIFGTNDRSNAKYATNTAMVSNIGHGYIRVKKFSASALQMTVCTVALWHLSHFVMTSITLRAAVTLELKKRDKQTKRVYIARTAVTRKLFGFHVTAVRACLFV